MTKENIGFQRSPGIAGRILYFQEESNISLTAFLEKTWAPRGQTPKAKVMGKRAGVAATSVVSRQGLLLFRP